MYHNFSLVSNTPSSEHLPEFRRTILDVHQANLPELSTPQDKLNLVLSIKHLTVLFVKNASRRSTDRASEVQPGLNTLWDVFITIAEILDSEKDESLHGQLVLQLLWTKEFDTLCRRLYPTVDGGFESWEAYEFAQRLHRR
jgi:hypothetical protein